MRAGTPGRGSEAPGKPETGAVMEKGTGLQWETIEAGDGAEGGRDHD